MPKVTINFIKLLLPIILLLSIFSCGKSGECDRDFYVEMTGLSMLKEAEIINCEDGFDWFKIAAFQLDKSQVRELLYTGDFEPVRSSLDMVKFPLKWVNKIFEEIDELSQYRKMDGETDCTITLKEDDQLLIVSIANPD